MNRKKKKPGRGEVYMLICGVIFFITGLIFLKGFSVNKDDSILQKFYYYVGGYGGEIFFCYMIWFSEYGDKNYYGELWMIFLIFYLLMNCRMNYFYKLEYLDLKMQDCMNAEKIYHAKRIWKISQLGKWIGITCIGIMILIML